MDAPEQELFEAWIHGEIVRALGRVPRDFATLTSVLPGIYPQDVLRALETVPRDVPHLASAVQSLAVSARDQAIPRPEWSGLSGLLPPHPLDFEWRFAPAAVATLAGNIRDVTTNGSRVALVGTPTLAISLHGVPESLLVDYYGLDADCLASAGLVNHLRAAKSADLLREVSIGAERYDTIVMDPPWYADYVCRFLHFAARSLQIDGHLLIAMPPCGTRPGVAAANQAILMWAERLGLVLESEHLGAVPYETPFFEHNALRAAGILNVAPDWRRGDLWVLRKIEAPVAEWPGDLVRPTWREFAFGPVRVRVDSGASAEGFDPCLQSIVEGDVLPSVSRRDSRRMRARVWTTGNRVFACEAPAKFAEMVLQWQHSPNGSVSDADRRARTHLFELIDRERAELAWPTRQEAGRPIDRVPSGRSVLG